MVILSLLRRRECARFNGVLVDVSMFCRGRRGGKLIRIVARLGSTIGV